MNINQVTISGNITRDASVRHAANKDVITFSVAVNDRIQENGEWKDRPNFIDCDYWVSDAGKLADRMVKGAKVAVSGRLRWSQWEKDGEKRSKVTVTAGCVEFLSPAQRAASDDADDIPF